MNRFANPEVRALLSVAAAAAILYACSSSGDPMDAGSAPTTDDASPASMVDSSASASSSGSSGGSSGSSGSEPSEDAAASSAGDDSGTDARAPHDHDAAPAEAVGPCDLYGDAGTPCVAAHSTVRALYGAYAGSLYQVTRASDETTLDVGVLAPGGFANAAAQDTFCAGTTCTISILYDQSPEGNDLRSAPGGGNAPKPDVPANATAAPVSVGGHHVYAIYVSPGTGYRNDTTKGVATGDEPEGEYMVTSGKHFDGSCCFDYGNAETNNKDNGAGHMEAVYFGSAPAHDGGAGPWAAADLENGLFADTTKGVGPNQLAMPYDYVTAIVKGEPNHWAVEAANAQAGSVTTIYDGARPTGYSPMHKEGAIILGIGGDNSNRSAGTFFEGCMTSGYPSLATDDAVQANIAAAGYGQ